MSKKHKFRNHRVALQRVIAACDMRRFIIQNMEFMTSLFLYDGQEIIRFLFEFPLRVYSIS